MRLVWLLINVFVWTLIAATSAVITGLFDWSGRGIRWIARMWSRILMMVAGVPYKLTGTENLEPGQEYIFAGNHESAFDIPLCFAAIPNHIVAVAKIELKRIPIFGWAMFLAGHVFVDRRNRERAIASMEKAHKSFLRYPRSILIYPEGTRSLDGEIHRFKKGAAVLGLSLKLPIVPMAMCGTGDVVRKHSWKLRPQEVELRLGKPIPTAELEYSDRNQLTIELQEKVTQLKKDWLAEKASQAG